MTIKDIELKKKEEEQDGTDWKAVIVLVLTFLMLKNSIDWKDFCESAKRNKLTGGQVDEIKIQLNERTGRLTTYIDSPITVYRGRVVGRDLYLSKANELFDATPNNKLVNGFELKAKDKKKLINMFDIGILKWFSEQDYSGADDSAKETREIIQRFICGDFRGYEAVDSLSPPSKSAKAGRANKKSQSVLYVAFDKNTCVYECRPIIGQHLSIAEIRVAEKLKLFDFTKAQKTIRRGVSGKLRVASTESEIDLAFSTPNQGNLKDYIPTQIIADIIRGMQFDGIIYKSSLRKGGKNMVLFDDKKCEVTKTDMITVKSTKVIYEDFFKSKK